MLKGALSSTVASAPEQHTGALFSSPGPRTPLLQLGPRGVFGGTGRDSPGRQGPSQSRCPSVCPPHPLPRAWPCLSDPCPCLRVGRARTCSTENPRGTAGRAGISRYARGERASVLISFPGTFPSQISAFSHFPSRHALRFLPQTHC